MMTYALLETRDSLRLPHIGQDAHHAGLGSRMMAGL